MASIGEHCLLFGMRSLAVSSGGLPSVAGNSIVLCDSIPDRLMQYNLGGVRRGHRQEPPAQSVQHCPPPRRLLLPLLLEQRPDILLQNKAFMGDETQVAVGGLSSHQSLVA